MNLADYRKDYYEFSAKTSELVRQLSYAGIALIWIFKPEHAEGIAVPSKLILPALLFFFALGLDFFHALSSTCIWGIYTRCKEKSGLKDHDHLNAPACFNWVALIMFSVKVIALILAYGFTFHYLLTLI